jgi:hypothetical protein
VTLSDQIKSQSTRQKSQAPEVFIFLDRIVDFFSGTESNFRSELEIGVAKNPQSMSEMCALKDTSAVTGMQHIG